MRRMPNGTDTALHYRLLKLIEERPEISQRELASELGLSLGKINYCLKAFISRGLVKVNNFRRSDNKLAYAYLLTPKGIEEKARVTVRFFRRVEAEYEALKQEMAQLQQRDATSAESGVPPEVARHIRERLPDVVAIYAFGSVASGQTHDESDLDLAVLADSPLEPGSLWQLAQDVAGMAGRPVDLVDLRRASTVMRMQVVAGGKRLYCRDAAACDGFEDFVFSDFARLNEERAGILEDVGRRGSVYG